MILLEKQIKKIDSLLLMEYHDMIVLVAILVDEVLHEVLHDVVQNEYDDPIHTNIVQEGNVKL